MDALGGVGKVGNAKYRSAAAVAKLKAPGRYAVGDGVQLQISKWHTKAWVFRYERFGRAHYMGLGPCDLISLAEARTKGREARRLLLDGVDPLALKRQKRNEAQLRQAREQTFEACARAYINAHDAGWSRASSAQWIASLERYVFPIIGKFPVSEIDLPLVLKVLEPIWLTVSETASRIRGRIESILGWATVRKLRQGDNPARWSSNLEHLLPSQNAIRQKKRHAALPYRDVGAFMSKLRAEEGVPPRALEFLILTASRTAEVLGARWEEIQNGMWVVPAERMKGRVEHRVPLSKRGIKLLAELPREGEYVFIGARAGAPMDKMSLHRVLARLGCNTTVHGFRSTFRDWAAETTAYPNHVVEQALAHAIGNAVERAYRRGDLFEKRRRLMQDWSDYCARARVEGDVVPLCKEVLG
jgi:integrase